MPKNEAYRDRLLILLLSSRGAKSRKKILKILVSGPMNCNQISKNLKLDWWTIQKHLQVLEDENLIIPITFGRRTFYKINANSNQLLELIEAPSSNKSDFSAKNMIP